ncbi:MAG: thymidylate synthase [Anaerocolumna sp.]|jgi:uncharacterized protein YdeI (YjbR/CyaY-like superfamily)|nr:thymidylate synthase [Anaerocolumna sp.]
MEINNLLSVNTREGLRAWLQDNCNIEKCCWAVVSITPQPDRIMYLDAVEEALCFGWIDGVKKKISESQVAQRLSPRVNKSSWTELNKERVRRLEKLGLMTDEGRKVLPDMSYEAFRIDEEVEQRLKEDRETYENFMAFPELYRRIRIDNIQREKKDLELYYSRLDKFISNTKKNKMYGDWNDKGRLLESSYLRN